MKTLVLLTFIFSISKTTNRDMYYPMEKLLAAAKDFYDDCNSYPLNPLELTDLRKTKDICWQGPYSKQSDIIDKFSDLPFEFIFENGYLVIISAGNDQVFNSEDDIKSNDSLSRKRKLVPYYINIKETKDRAKISYMILAIISILAIFFLIKKKQR